MRMVVVENSNILFAIPCVENAYDETALIEAIPTEKIFEREPELLKIAFSNMPSILVKEADVLVVNEIGKNFSGTRRGPEYFRYLVYEIWKWRSAGETDLLSGPAGQFSRKRKWNGPGRCDYKADF